MYHFNAYASDSSLDRGDFDVHPVKQLLKLFRWNQRRVLVPLTGNSNVITSRIGEGESIRDNASAPERG